MENIQTNEDMQSHTSYKTTEKENEFCPTETPKTNNYYMLLEEMCEINRLPLSLHRLLGNLSQKDVKSPSELLIAVVYYLFLESGFVPLTLPTEQRSTIRTHWGFSFIAQVPDYSCILAADEIVEQHRKCAEATTEQNYEFKLNLLGHSDKEMPLIIRKIFGGGVLCVNLSLGESNQWSSIVLSVNEFIPANESYDINLIEENPQKYFTNVRKLNEHVKQMLIAPLRNMVMYESAYPNAALHGMPKEVLSALFGYFRADLKTLQKISQTCVYLRNMAISFLQESKIQLKHRRPTPMIYDASDHINRPYSRYRIFNDIPELFFHRYHPQIYHYPNR